jgi:hypothetical protein
MKALRIVQYAFLLIGTAMLVGAFYWYQNTLQFTQKALKADKAAADKAAKETAKK